MYRHAHHHGHHYGHHYWHNWHTDWSYCRHRAHHLHAYSDEAAFYKTNWFHVPESYLGYVINHSAEQVQSMSHGHQPRVSRRPSKCVTHAAHRVSSTRRCSRSHSDMRMTGKARRPATSAADTRKCTHATPKTDPICGYACGSALRNMCTTPSFHDVGTGTIPATAAGGAPVHAAAEEPLSPSPSHPSQSLYSSALRRTPLFVKHESIQTTPSKTRTRSAFAVVRTDGESPSIGQSRTPARDGDAKATETGASAEPGQPDAHHQHHHHHGVCWHDQSTKSCGHAWAHSFHHQGPCVHQSKSESDTAWAGFFINFSKDDWGVLLKEAWGRITNMIRRSRGTILLERNPPATAENTATSSTTASTTAPVGESSGHADNAPCYDAHGHDQHAGYCYAHTASNEAYFYNHNCYQHREAEGDTFFYSEKQPHSNHSHFQDASEEFYDCFESQVSAPHQY